MRVPTIAGLAAGLLISILSLPAGAAPQILAALPTFVGIPLVCQDGTCQADLSTYCLQQKRPAPGHGTVYTPAAAEDFTLVIRTAEGPRTVPAAEHVSFVESRGFMAIAAVIDERHLSALGGTDAVITVGEAASLLPVPVAGDPDPLTEAEIAYVTKWRRDQGKDIVDKVPNAKAAQVLASIANRLPRHGSTDPARLDTIWEETIADEFESVRPDMVVPVMQRARLEFEQCRTGGARYSFGGVRRCLEYRHDNIIRDLNIDYWETKPRG